jgi:tetratricopeptide (TPR) repeat protein
VNTHLFDGAPLLQQGFQLLRAGNPAAAERHARGALAAAPGQPSALNLLGLALHAQARNPEAADVFAELLRVEPGVRGHWMNYGTVLRAIGRAGEALEAYSRAGSLGEKSADFLYNIGLLHLESGNYEAARRVLRDAHAANPRDAEISFYYATACSQALATADGLAALSDWPQMDRLTPELVAKIGNALLNLGDANAAAVAIEQVLADASADPQALLQAVLALERMNRIDRANAVMARLQQVAPESLGSDYGLARARLAQRAERHEDAIAGFRKLVDESGQDDRFVHQFPLARSLDALGRYDEAFQVLEEAHAAQTSWTERTMPEIPQLKSDTMRITRFGCDPADVAQWDHAGAPAYADSPIFIVAFPRSGTTLLEQALDAHPRLKSMDEQPYLQNVIERLKGPDTSYPERMATLTRAQLDGARDYYWSLVKTRLVLHPGEQLIDKNPLNILRLPVIARLFPHARIVLAIRHPCDVLVSCFMQLFRAEFAWHCRDVPTLALAMRRAFDYWHQQASLLLPDVAEVRYEAFVARFEQEVRRLAEFLELDWTDAMLAPGEHAQVKGYISTPSYAQVLQPVHSRSIGRWRHYEKQVRPALTQLQPWIDQWGYDGPSEQ